MEVIEYMQPSRKRGRQQMSASGFHRRVAPRRAYVPGRRRSTYRRKAEAGEMKFHDIDIDDGGVAATWTVQAELLEIPEGVGEEQRVGRNITIKKIGWRWTCTKASGATAAATSDVFRLMVIQDKQANRALPAATLVVQSDNYQSFNKLANSKRFRILYDRTFDLWSPSGSGRGVTDTLSFGEQTISGTWFKDCNIQIEYDNSAATGDITTIRSNNIFCMMISQGGGLSFDSKFRFRYTDR